MTGHEQRQAARSKSPTPIRQSAAVVVKSLVAARAKSPALRPAIAAAVRDNQLQKLLISSCRRKDKAQIEDKPLIYLSNPEPPPLLRPWRRRSRLDLKRQNSQPKILAPKRSLEPVSGNDGHDGDDAL
jgi:hypothetical protein